MLSSLDEKQQQCHVAETTQQRSLLRAYIHTFTHIHMLCKIPLVQLDPVLISVTTVAFDNRYIIRDRELALELFLTQGKRAPRIVC